MENSYNDYREMARGVRRDIENERDMYISKAGQMEEYLKILDTTDGLIRENGKLREDIESLQQQLADEKRQRADLEMKMTEITKLSTDMAKKSPEEGLLKALRIYVNKSKRKTADKRAFAKTAVLEIANVNTLVLPEDLASAIESLDDEQSEPKVVNVQGNYNDIHDNNTVNQK